MAAIQEEPEQLNGERFDAYNRYLQTRRTVDSGSAFAAGWEAAKKRLTEDYYTLAEVRLAADLNIVEYGSCNQRLRTIVDLIDKKRPELDPNGPR